MEDNKFNNYTLSDDEVCNIIKQFESFIRKIANKKLDFKYIKH